ncbi:S-adenosylmethionine mitochondrial carrier protein-like [Penaeus chinensis]|uniref:S-adenosylmethionine mitochondrial carrier protein-like n=1 Tax=Penaeus chinensis TaxID=139456 RepID=UPI001FB7E6E8|nr:S-adenosylmethionine mitochondrial carrier protein-like [Penaeus chinensis]XP_047495163.1 S-adenosylmethionine mitochondrial carrier protein-like [Penaeus chinensis]
MVNENNLQSQSPAMDHREPDMITALLSGGAAGLGVDVTLFPLDTIKTRLQSEAGFRASGGFKGIYSGIGPAAIASAPTAATFFLAYEGVKQLFSGKVPSKYEPGIHMFAASAGEVAACVIRVPVEVVKQRMQARMYQSSLQVVQVTLQQEGFRGLYRGYMSTVIREVPFSIIQFPLWELFKKWWSNQQGRLVDSWQSSLCGALAGGMAAAITTPLDVAKTRIMLADHNSSIAKGNISNAMKAVYRQQGISGLFAGVIPRTVWISLGGAVFFGIYEKSKNFIQSTIKADK